MDRSPCSPLLVSDLLEAALVIIPTSRTPFGRLPLGRNWSQGLADDQFSTKPFGQSRIRYLTRYRYYSVMSIGLDLHDRMKTLAGYRGLLRAPGRSQRRPETISTDRRNPEQHYVQPDEMQWIDE